MKIASLKKEVWNYAMELKKHHGWICRRIAARNPVLHSRHFHRDHRATCQVQCRAVANGPTILTTLGIFATFVGIALGLAQFDANNVQGSVPRLLDGLKTAFWASVFGVGAALTIKFRDHLLGHQQEPAHHLVEDVGARELLDGISRVEKALVGSEDGSLITQLKFLRTETRDELRQVRDAQTKALEKLSDMGSRALIEALKDVIRDFNTKLTEQFGENFKQLNAAVEKLVEWQGQYRDFVDSASRQLKEIVDDMSKASTDYGKVVDRSSDFAKLAEALGLTIADVQNRQGDLKRQSEALAELLRQSSGALPEVERKVVELARQLSDGIVQNQRTLDEALRKQAQAVDEAVKTSGEGIRKNAEEAGRSISQVVERSLEQLEASARRVSDRLDESHKLAAASIKANAESLAQEIRQRTEEAARLATEHASRLQSLAERAQGEIAEAARSSAAAATRVSEDATKRLVDGAQLAVDRTALVTQGVADAIKDQSATLTASIQQSAETAIRATAETSARVAAASESAQNEIAASAKETGKILTEVQAGFSKSVSEGAESLRSSLRATVEAMSTANAEHNRQLAELASKTKEQVTVLDKALGEELERSLKSLGRQLAALSEKFVADYQPLTENLRRVVEIAKRINVQ
jgi:methyl-accepting chemotaxis protein